jgi:hypothetical protein
LKDYQPLPQINFNCIKIYERKDFELFFGLDIISGNHLEKFPTKKKVIMAARWFSVYPGDLFTLYGRGRGGGRAQ